MDDDTRAIQRAQPQPFRPGIGRTLADVLAKEPLPPLPWAVWMARQAALQLDQAHRMGVVPGRVALRSFAVVDTPRGDELVLDVDLTATPLVSPEVPPALDDLIDRLLSKDRTKRPTAAAVADALKG